MKIERNSILATLAVLVVVALAIWVWPTKWARSNGGLVMVGPDQKLQVAPMETRVHRFNGKVQYLTLGGWANPVATPPAPAAQPAVPGPGMAPAVP
ncbi:MAG TPA: hypothetical protein VMY39_03315 [Planctomycetota bacterium]|nr:hypothetical protein [Planctomycetota bacterium]